MMRVCFEKLLRMRLEGDEGSDEKLLRMRLEGDEGDEGVF